jgi:hypothetical protein
MRKHPNATIIDNIKELHRIVLASSTLVYTLAVTIPQIEHLLHSERNDERLYINQEIRNFQSRCSRRIALVELESVFNLSVPENKAKFWRPGTHPYYIIFISS